MKDVKFGQRARNHDFYEILKKICDVKKYENVIETYIILFEKLCYSNLEVDEVDLAANLLFQVSLESYCSMLGGDQNIHYQLEENCRNFVGSGKSLKDFFSAINELIYKSDFIKKLDDKTASVLWINLENYNKKISECIAEIINHYIENFTAKENFSNDTNFEDVEDIRWKIIEFIQNDDFEVGRLNKDSINELQFDDLKIKDLLSLSNKIEEMQSDNRTIYYKKLKLSIDEFKEFLRSLDDVKFINAFSDIVRDRDINENNFILSTISKILFEKILKNKDYKAFWQIVDREKNNPDIGFVEAIFKAKYENVATFIFNNMYNLDGFLQLIKNFPNNECKEKFVDSMIREKIEANDHMVLSSMSKFGLVNDMDGRYLKFALNSGNKEITKCILKYCNLPNPEFNNLLDEEVSETIKPICEYAKAVANIANRLGENICGKNLEEKSQINIIIRNCLMTNFNFKDSRILNENFRNILVSDLNNILSDTRQNKPSPYKFLADNIKKALDNNQFKLPEKSCLIAH